MPSKKLSISLLKNAQYYKIHKLLSQYKDQVFFCFFYCSPPQGAKKKESEGETEREKDSVPSNY